MSGNDCQTHVHKEEIIGLNTAFVISLYDLEPSYMHFCGQKI